MNKENFISLSELARQLGTYKSKLSYYVKLGLISPITSIGRMQIYDKKVVERTLKKVERLKEQGLSMEDIKVKLDK